MSPGGDTWFKQGPPAKTGKDRRTPAGFKNPKQDAKPMRPLWEASALSPPPATNMSHGDFMDWVQDKNRRLRVWSPTRTRSKDITGYQIPGQTKSAVVLGHKVGASTVWNQGGHKRRRSENQAYNKTTAAYHGLEDYIWSAQSGHKEPPYTSPRPDKGSHRSHFDDTDVDYSGGGPWRSYKPFSEQDTIAFISGRLTAQSALAGTDGEYDRAVIELANLQTTFSKSLARQLIGVIDKRGW
jgi:hypothetical protein